MFAVYNKLFLRPKIRGAIFQYQSTLLSQVTDDIELLKKKVLHVDNTDNTLNAIRDFPEISNKIILINQLAKKLEFYQNRVREVLGDDWEA